MKTLFEHIETAKGKPHHIRRRITFAVAGCGTALVALVWVGAALSSNSFAIQGSNFADSIEQEDADSSGTVGSGTAGIAGAAAALPDANVPAHIEIVDTSPATSTSKQAEQTTIPF